MFSNLERILREGSITLGENLQDINLYWLVGIFVSIGGLFGYGQQLSPDPGLLLIWELVKFGASYGAAGLIIYIIFIGFGKLLVWGGGWYPRLIYLPNIKANFFVRDEEIRMKFTKKGRETAFVGITFESILKNGVIISNFFRIMGGGIPPAENRAIYPRTEMEGKFEIDKRIGTIGDGMFYLVMGTGRPQENYAVRGPGEYEYNLSYYGEFRGRIIENMGECKLFVLKENGEFKIREC